MVITAYKKKDVFSLEFLLITVRVLIVFEMLVFMIFVECDSKI